MLILVLSCAHHQCPALLLRFCTHEIRFPERMSQCKRFFCLLEMTAACLLCVCDFRSLIAQRPTRAKHVKLCLVDFQVAIARTYTITDSQV